MGVSAATFAATAKVFDLSNMLNGEYLFAVDTNEGYVEKPFSIKTETTRVVTPISTK